MARDCPGYRPQYEEENYEDFSVAGLASFWGSVGGAAIVFAPVFVCVCLDLHVPQLVWELCR